MWLSYYKSLIFYQCRVENYSSVSLRCSQPPPVASAPTHGRLRAQLPDLSDIFEISFQTVCMGLLFEFYAGFLFWPPRGNQKSTKCPPWRPSKGEKKNAPLGPPRARVPLGRLNAPGGFRAGKTVLGKAQVLCLIPSATIPRGYYFPPDTGSEV